MWLVRLENKLAGLTEVVGELMQYRRPAGRNAYKKQV
jgi:hypothetical protein